jgi:membrane protease YdiL (CAAX protease family)
MFTILKFGNANLHNIGTMAHLALKRYSYWGQLGLLLVFVGAGFILAGIISAIPLFTQLDLSLKELSGKQVLDKLLVPENASLLRWIQFFATLALFFIPVYMYAWICHKKPWAHMGFTQKPTAQQLLVAAIIMIACLPIVSGLASFTEALPWPKAVIDSFNAAELEYEKQVKVLARMNNVADLIASLFIVALLPALFEEALFRGGVQNLLSRWIKLPIVAIIITSIVFSAVHGSYLGFLSRFFLGFVLGFMYYRTGNIWLNVAAHFVNNAIAIITLYVYTRNGQQPSMKDMEGEMPWWLMLVSAVVVFLLFKFFERVSQQQIINPGQEELLPDAAQEPVWMKQ